MNGARSDEELIVWQLAYQLKLGVYELIRTSAIRTEPAWRVFSISS